MAVWRFQNAWPKKVVGLINLQLTIASDGSARMDGAILVVSALDTPLPGGGRPTRLAATGTPARADCADANGDGKAGLIRVTADFVDVRSGERIPVVLETAAGEEIDASGIYRIALQIGEERAAVETRVRVGPGRRPRTRRRGR